MWWQYLLVFLGSMIVDIVPIPLPPAFTVMILLQIIFDLQIWPTVLIGVAGSIIGRLILTLYIPKVSTNIFSKEKNEDIELLGDKMKDKGWKGHLFVLIDSLMPLPTTPLFLAAGIAKLKPFYIIPAFTIGKLISDAIAVVMGNYAVKNTNDLIHGMFSVKSVVGLVLGLLLIFALLFIDWHAIIKYHKLKLKFNIWSKKEESK